MVPGVLGRHAADEAPDRGGQGLHPADPRGDLRGEAAGPCQEKAPQVNFGLSSFFCIIEWCVTCFKGVVLCEKCRCVQGPFVLRCCFGVKWPLGKAGSRLEDAGFGKFGMLEELFCLGPKTRLVQSSLPVLSLGLG